MIRLYHRPFLLLLAAQLGASSQMAGAENGLAEGERYYAQHQYVKAAGCFKSELEQDYDNAAAHYCLGNTYLQLHRTDAAIKEYEEAAKIDETGTAGMYSRMALNRLRPPAPDPPPDAAQFDPAAQAAPEPPRRSDQSIADEKEQAKKITEIREQADRQISRLKTDMQSEIEANGPTLWARGRIYYTPDNDPIKKEYGSRIQHIQEDAQKRIESVQQYYKTRAAARGESN